MNKIKIKIADLEVYCNHGVYEAEKMLGQKFLACATLSYIKSEKSETDSLENTIDYSEVCHFIFDFMKENTFKLIETAADKLSLAILQKYALAESVEIEIKKPWAPIGLPLNYVSAQVKRGRRGVFIGLGSNLGDREKTIKKSLDILCGSCGIEVLKVSAFKETKPYGKTGQPDFINACAKISTYLSPGELLNVLKDIEKKCGRKESEEKWGPRELDLDILFYGDLIFSRSDLIIPHCDLHNRLFVLEPLCELEPFFIHPVFKLPVSELLERLRFNL